MISRKICRHFKNMSRTCRNACQLLLPKYTLSRRRSEESYLSAKTKKRGMHGQGHSLNKNRKFTNCRPTKHQNMIFYNKVPESFRGDKETSCNRVHSAFLRAGQVSITELFFMQKRYSGYTNIRCPLFEESYV